MNIRATARLQFHKGFTFADALPLVSYFAKMGISHIYASPILKARPGSTYGYDVIDPTQVNPELGGEADLEKLVSQLRKYNMGFIVDFVPNHMAVGGAANPWWLDVLEWGKLSAYARFFDIQWNSPDPLLEGQLLIPVLRAGYGEVLVAGEITLHFDAQSGSFYAQHFDHKFPLYPPTYNELLSKCNSLALQTLGRRFALLEKMPDQWEQAGELKDRLSEYASQDENHQKIMSMLANFSIDDRIHALPAAEQYQDGNVKRLHKLLERQHYRLADWRTASDDINWRRFFDINELGALRAERDDVFEAIHAKIFELISRGLIDGLRIDHIDGLANPRAYSRKLRRRAERLMPHGKTTAAATQTAGTVHFPIYVEKILADQEQLPENWQVDGTTGYDFMNQVSLLQHDSTNAALLTDFWQEETGRPADFMAEVIEARKLILSTSLTGDFETVAHGLLLIARAELATRDITLGAIRRALFELVVHFPVYRTYSRACVRSEQDQVFFQQAMTGARTTLTENEWPLLEQLDAWLGGEPLHQLPPGTMRKLRYRTLIRFQQLTSPIAAKSVEDTACYRSGALLSRNDVGFNPEKLGISCADFHTQCSERARNFPGAMIATATHDHKRGEDTRARLAVLSERAEWFIGKVKHWRQLAAPIRESIEGEDAPSAGDEIMLYQTLLGTWPLELDIEALADNQNSVIDTYLERIQAWQEKSLREAKLRSSWSAPNATYEAACKNFSAAIFHTPEAIELRNSIAAAALEIAPAGALNSLTQTLLRMTTPGIPDLYQGTELWDFSLVDPDNRRAVNFEPRIANVNDSTTEADELINQWRDGRIKQHLITQTLNLRRELASVFSDGSYIPLEVAGEKSNQIIAFARQLDHHLVIVVAPRLVAHMLINQPTPYPLSEHWGDTHLILPSQLMPSQSVPPTLTGVFSRAPLDIENKQLFIRNILNDFPVNILFTSSVNTGALR